MQSTDDKPERGARLITIDDFMKKLGIRGRSTFRTYERTRENFPKRVVLSASMIRFNEQQADAYVASLTD